MALTHVACLTYHDVSTHDHDCAWNSWGRRLWLVRTRCRCLILQCLPNARVLAEKFLWHRGTLLETIWAAKDWRVDRSRGTTLHDQQNQGAQMPCKALVCCVMTSNLVLITIFWMPSQICARSKLFPPLLIFHSRWSIHVRRVEF